MNSNTAAQFAEVICTAMSKKIQHLIQNTNLDVQIQFKLIKKQNTVTLLLTEVVMSN